MRIVEPLRRRRLAAFAGVVAVAVALVRGFARSRTGDLGNFWADLVRGVVRVLLPISVIAAVLLIAAGAVQNFGDIHTLTTLTGDKQAISPGAVASQEAIKDIGTNGGGFFNANSAHPFENPSGFTNLLEIFLLLVIPFSLPRTFGKMVGNVRQGYAIVAAMGETVSSAMPRRKSRCSVPSTGPSPLKASE